MEKAIKKIEDMSLNAWPSHKMELYDGWILRFSYFYTHRTNCVEQIGPSSIPIEEKIDFCEDAYHRWGTPSIFKITPLLPDDFEKRLIDRRYASNDPGSGSLADHHATCQCAAGTYHQ